MLAPDKPRLHFDLGFLLYANHQFVIPTAAGEETAPQVPANRCRCAQMLLALDTFCASPLPQGSTRWMEHSIRLPAFHAS